MKILLEEFQMNKFFFQKKVTFKGSLYNTKYLYDIIFLYEMIYQKINFMKYLTDQS